MTTARTTSPTRALAALASLFALSLLALAIQTPSQTRSSNDGCLGSYGWPVKPFDRTHPVRANFGDPRTRFAGSNTPETLLEGDGMFSFHQGLDISAPDGEPVYAVASGTVVRARGGRVTVNCGNGRSFQYWHVDPAVRVGQHTVAGETVVGFIQPKREHVHLTQLDRGAAVNPLAPGRLSPYRDTTVPFVTDISVSRASDQRVDVVVEAVDTPAMSVSGRWHGFPVTPAMVTWRIERGGCVVVPRHVARDVRRSVPKNDRFWDTFARGTYQNWPVFAGRKSQFTPGTYLFALSIQPSAALMLRDAVFELVVTVADTGGNRTERRFGIAFRDVLSSLSGS